MEDDHAVNHVTVKRIEELEAYEGPHVRPGIRFRYAAKALGVSAWGMNVLELAAHCTSYPEHDHAKDGQEEVYVVLRGVATLRAGQDSWRLEPGTLARVPAERTRSLTTGAEGATVLVVGGTPGKAYEKK